MRLESKPWWARGFRPAAQIDRRRFRPALVPLEGRQLLSTFTVTNTSGDATTRGSLPWAIHQANYSSPGFDVINFNLRGPGPHIIQVKDTLFLNEQIAIQGTSQPGYNGSPLVVVKGDGSVPSIFLLQGESSGSTIQGLAISGFGANAVTIMDGSQGNWIQNNYLGFYHDASGATHLNMSETSRHAAGVGIQSSFNVVRYNTISGVYNGVNIGEDIGGKWSGKVYKTNAIQYNQIGTDPTGATASGYGNDSDGIFLGAGASENFLGPDNVISGNKSSGVELLHSTNWGNVVFANLIGMNRAGTAAIPNGELGILFAHGATGNAIGGPFGGNLIAGNLLGGISLGTAAFGGASGNWVQNNVIGLNAAQTAPLGSQGVGINIESGSASNSITGNVVAGNLVNGFQLSKATGNYMASNFIGRAYGGAWIANGGFGVALLAGASNNWVVSNEFGSNTVGNIYVDAAARGNALQDVPGILGPGAGGGGIPGRPGRPRR